MNGGTSWIIDDHGGVNAGWQQVHTQDDAVSK